MKTYIRLTSSQHKEVWRHLLRSDDNREYAAFLFARVLDVRGQRELYVESIRLILEPDFQTQRSNYFELSDEARVSIIKEAHVSKLSLIEVHSHPFPGKWAAAFSLADMSGFAETVPNMLWRLPDRPYTAIVVAPYGFDALTWSSTEDVANIEGLAVGKKILKPTNFTLEKFDDLH